MPHFREDYTFIVAAPNDKVEEIHKKLVDFGCKRVLACRDDVHKGVKTELQKLNNSGGLMTAAVRPSNTTSQFPMPFISE